MTVPPTTSVGSLATLRGWMQFTTLSYCTPPGGAPLLLDLFVPPGAGPFPVIVRAHGGAWLEGDRSLGVRQFGVPMVAAGFAFASVDYRLAPKTFPDPVEDVACAVRFLRAHASQLRLDPSRFGGMGDSAGGQLVALLATGGAPPPPAGSEYAGESTRLRAVVTISAIMRFDAQLLKKLPYTASALGTHDLVQMNRYAPLDHVSSDSPPFLIVHGESDDIVPVQQAIDFDHALKSAGVPSVLVLVRHGGHEILHAGGTPSPTSAQITVKIVDFFRKYLKS